MKKFIMGKKIGMTQIFNEDGTVIPVTVIKAGPCKVIQKKTIETDSYNSLKVSFDKISEKKLNKPDRGQFANIKADTERILKEFKVDEIEKYEVGQEIRVSDMFEAGDSVDISGISKGKGFQSTIKRYGHSGGKDTHGSMYHRRPGSMGASASPSRVFKGKRLPGHMGTDKVTAQNIDVIRVDSDNDVLIVKGCVPGPKGNILTVRDSVKKSK